VQISDRGLIDPIVLNCPSPQAPLGDHDDVYFGTEPQDGHPKSCPHTTGSSDAWFAPEPMGIWGLGHVSRLNLEGADWGAKTVRLDLHLSTYAGLGFAKGNQTIAIKVHGVVLAREIVHIGITDQVVTLTLPRAMRDAPDRVTIEFETDPTLTPAQLGGPKADTRSLGVYLRALQVSTSTDGA
jgi:hypothetical protein